MIKMFTAVVAAAVATAVFPVSVFAQSSGTKINCGQTYTVVRGDTLSRISARAYNNGSFLELYQVNVQVIGADPDRIFVGQRLEIPCTATSGTIQANADLTGTAQIPEVTNDTGSEPVAEPEVAVAEVANLVFTFNKSSAPKFIINAGIIDIYLAEIAEVTEGRVQFIDPPVMNRDPKVQLDLVTSGQVDGAYVFNGNLGASHPLLQLPMVPLMGGSAEQTAVALWRMHNDYLSQTNYFDEARLLGFIAAPAAHIWRRSDEPVAANHHIADMNNYSIPYFEGLDTRGPAAVRESVQLQLMAQDEDHNGTLTFFIAHGAARAAGIWTEDRTVTEVDNGLYTPTFSVVLSNDAWAQISEEDRAAIDAISGENLATRSASWDVFDNGHRSHMLETGLNTVKADPQVLEELDTVSEARVALWIDEAERMGISGTAAINAYRQSLESLQDRLLFR